LTVYAKNVKDSLTAREKDAIKAANGIVQMKIRQRRIVM
jgi:hypothetical protein